MRPHISSSLNDATRECYKFGGKECVIRAWACDARGEPRVDFFSNERHSGAVRSTGPGISIIPGPRLRASRNDGRSHHAIRHQDRGRGPDRSRSRGRSSTSPRSSPAASPRRFPECIGEPYEDGSGTKYLALIGQPILIYGADRAALSRALERALARNVTPAVYTEDMFKTTHDAANREVVKAVARADLNLVGLAMRAERKVIDKIVDGLKFHS